ncbi:hypothetical protein ACW6AV_002200 [Edwardsiella piscicida]|uniref:hypothetical protein n=1 Tax=Edwardsiella piscicida TaxID=1263550 RepID=UPI000D510B38|nr:hypothetical protein [Edwardsiella piscicida]ELM3736818.1 hypothetical protein [Edwardsiella piscicida]QBB12102.1 hypothetical protein EVK84_05810 [Edwardsiella piscicida]UCQ14997.1 hypothetical protein DCE53_01500 [Edwardsiella piscicida]UCQ38184.1 hypothetical protein DCF36_01480 [Edwardsiella piscicida]WGS77402.1 hypothetical protein PED68_01560 [Edwardsiella piscicida]
MHTDIFFDVENELALRKRVMVNFLSTKVDREALIAFQLFKKKTQTQSLSKEKKQPIFFFYSLTLLERQMRYLSLEGRPLTY